MHMNLELDLCRGIVIFYHPDAGMASLLTMMLEFKIT
jgi:hypothetical protein